MAKSCSIVLVILFFALILINSASAATINTASCSQSDVLSTYNSASSGDTINIPSCSQTDWGANSINVAKANLTIQGQGIGNTIISGSGNGIYPQGESANGLRITGIEFRNFNQAIFNYNNWAEGVKKLRVDHCKFLNTYVVFNSYGHVTGVFDHDIFEDVNSGFRIFGDDNRTATFPFAMGTSDAMFIEDSTLIVNNIFPSHFITSRTGSQYVVRHNTFTYNLASGWSATIDAHGMCEGSMNEQRGSFTFEVYDNAWNGTQGANGKTMQFRGGQGVVFNNRILSYNVNMPFLFLDDYRLASDCATNCYQGCCTTYPCIDQITQTYIWNNTFLGNALDMSSVNENYIKLGRDYWKSSMPGYVPYTYPHPLTQAGSGSGIIPEDRRINWSIAGVPGGIPNRTTSCTTAACNTLFAGAVNATSINNAINSAPSNTVVRIPAGNFTITNAIVPRSNVTLRGAGIGRTIINVNAGTSGAVLADQIGLGYGISGNITSGYTKGSNSITVPNPSGIALGNMMLIYEANDPDIVWSRWGNIDLIRQPVMVTGINGNKISFTPQLVYTYQASLNPRFSTYYPNPIAFFGLEDLTINQVDEGQWSTVWFAGTYASWIKGIEVSNCGDICLTFTQSVQNEVRGCYLHDTLAANEGYGVIAYTENTGLLVEDNIMERLWTASMLNNAEGSVFSYNYAYNMFVPPLGFWPHQTPGFIIQHGPHGLMTLWEGNVGQGIQSDGYHGSNSHQTIFRNWFNGLHPTYTSNRKMIDLDRFSYYYNVVGNVLGDSSWAPAAYEMSGQPDYATQPVIYRLGYPDMGNNAYNLSNPPSNADDGGLDTKVKATLLRHGNYDYYTKSTIWDSNISDHSIPASLIYSAKPAWFGSASWPPIGPDVTGYAAKIPAQIRYEAMASAQDTTPPVISNVLSLTISQNSAAISWTTDDLSDSQAEYGTSIGYGSSTALDTNTVTSHSATLSGLLSSTTYHYRVKSRNAAGNLTASNDYSFTTTAPDLLAPTISITSPSNGSVASGTIMISASASDNVGVAGVQFKIDNANISSEDTASPYSITWDSSSIANGTHTISAVARDAAGNMNTSLPITIIAANAPSAGKIAAAYSFDENSGTAINDASGSGNTGTLTNGPLWIAGKFGSALQFDGSNDYATIPNSGSLNISGKNITIEFWANVTSGSGDYAIINKPWNSNAMTAPYYQFGIEYSSGSGFAFYFGDTSSALHGPYTIPASYGTWQHVAFTYDGANVKGYLNGNLALKTAQTSYIQARGFDFRLGVDGSYGQPYKGLLDEVRIYNKAISQSQIQQDMITPISASRADTNVNGCIELSELMNFISLWKFNNLDVTLRDIISAIGLWKWGC